MIDPDKTRRKKIQVDNLKVGMYVADLGVKWMDHSFLRQQFVIKDESVIREIRDAGIQEVYIDTQRGLDDSHAPTEAEVKEQIETEMLQIFSDVPEHRNRRTAREEMQSADKLKHQASEVILKVMQDVRLGEQLRLERIDPVVDRICTSVLRNENALMSLCRIKDKDTYTLTHSVSVSTLLISFAHALEMDEEDIRHIGTGGLLHDIGKTRIPHRILGKMGKLTEREFQIMKEHVNAGQAVLEGIEGFSPISMQVVTEHHERYDGTGYPHAKAQDDISRVGQMAAICDVYDAITSQRIYHNPVASHEALSQMLEWGKYQFNMELVHIFIRTVGIYPVGTLVLMESGKVGVVVDHFSTNLLQPVIRVFYDRNKGQHITPRDIDLSRSNGHGGGDRIVRHESAEALGIDPMQHLL